MVGPTDVASVLREIVKWSTTWIPLRYCVFSKDERAEGQFDRLEQGSRKSSLDSSGKVQYLQRKERHVRLLVATALGITLGEGQPRACLIRLVRLPSSEF